MGRQAANVTDYRALARARLPHFLFEYLDGGSYDEVTLRRNVEDLHAIALKQRVLRDVSNIDLSAELLGKIWAMPVGLGLLVLQYVAELLAVATGRQPPFGMLHQGPAL